MINVKLQREIISYVFNVLGIFKAPCNLIECIIDQKYMIDKKLAFENEDGKRYTNDIYAMTSKLDNSTINIMVCDIKEDVDEFALVIQMDKFPSHALRLSLDEDDNGSFKMNVDDNKWIDTSIMVQAKVLVGIESLCEIFTEWKKLDNYNDMYKTMIGFLNLEELSR